MADQKIELEIVLDDGSIKKAFGTIKTEAEKAGKETDNAFGSIGSFGAATVVLNQGIELFQKLSHTIKEVGQEILNLALEGEKALRIQTQFNVLTDGASIATEKFQKQLEESVSGLLGQTEALEIANKAIVRLGATAQNLPEIFELARKAAKIGFGDMASNAEIFATAIQTGQTRMLRQLGIVADVTKEQEKFARSIGLTASQLTEEQKAFVNSEVILKAAEKKFGDVSSTVDSLSASIQRFKVLQAEAFESFAIGFNKAFGPAIKGFIDGLGLALYGNVTAQKAAAVATKDLGVEIDKLNAKLAIAQDRLLNARTDTQFNVYTRQVKELSAEIAILNQRQQQQKLIENDLLAKRIESYGAWKKETDARQLNEEQEKQAAIAKNERDKKFADQLGQFNQQKISAREQNLQFIDDQDKLEAEKKLIFEDQKTQIEQKGITDRKAIQDQYSNDKGFDQEQRDALELAQRDAQEQQLSALKNKYEQQSLDAFDQQAKRRQQQFKNFAVVAKTFFFDVISQGFQQVGAALVNGENAFQAFGKVFLGILGDIVIALGNSFIAAGIANTFIPLFGFGGIGAIGAGAALVVLGGALKALSGGSGTSSFSQSPGPGNQGGGNFSDTNNFNPANPVQADRVQPNTVVNFTIQGDVFDSNDTQDRIVKLINDGVDSKGLVVRGT